MATNNDRRDWNQDSNSANERSGSQDQRNMQGNREEGMNSPSRNEGSQSDYSANQRGRSMDTEGDWNSESEESQRMQGNRSEGMNSPSRSQNDDEYSAGQRNRESGNFSDTDSPSRSE